MQLTVRWHGKLADIVFEDHNTTVETSLLDRAEQRDLAEHLREIADELSQMREAVSELAERLLAQPEPEGLTDEELMAVFWQGAGLSGAGTGDHILRGLRAVLARWGRP